MTNPTNDNLDQAPIPQNGTDSSASPQPSDQSAEYLAGWKRALADYENLKKMSVTLRDEDRRRVRSQVAELLLPVVDNFGFVTKHIPAVEDPSSDFGKNFTAWVAGIHHIERQFLEVLGNLGVQPIDALNQPFNPNLHEAGGTKAVEGVASGQVVEELIRGWKIGDVVLRPSKVIISE